MAQREMYLLFNSQLRISHKRKKLITYNQRVWIYNSTFVFSALMAVPLLDNQVFICKDLFQPQILILVSVNELERPLQLFFYSEFTR